MQRQDQVLSVPKILKFDPLVSDTACQNRAVFLVDIAKKILSHEPITSTEREAILASEILTQTKKSSENPFGYIEKETTENDQLPNDIFKEFIKKYAVELGLTKKGEAAQKKKIVSYFKKILADFTLQYLQKKTNIKLLDEYQIFSDPKNIAYFTLDDFSIPILPLYLTAKMMLQYIVKENVPFLINFTRIEANTNNEKCLGKTSIYYRSNRNNQLVETVLSDVEPIIIANIFSFIGDKYKCDSDFLTESSFEECVLNFKALGIIAVVMLAAAAHYPYSKKTKTKCANDPMFNLPEPVANVGNGDFTPINLNESSPQEFAKLRSAANQLGFFQKRVTIDHIYSGLPNQPDTQNENKG